MAQVLSNNTEFEPQTRASMPTTADLRDLDKLAELLDNRFRLPIIPVRLGLDTIVGLIPGVGDVATLVPAGYIIARGVHLGARKRTIAKMIGNSSLDAILGAIPLIGDAFDVFFKSNLRNIALLRADLERMRHQGPSQTRVSVP